MSASPSGRLQTSQETITTVPVDESARHEEEEVTAADEEVEKVFDSVEEDDPGSGGEHEDDGEEYEEEEVCYILICMNTKSGELIQLFAHCFMPGDGTKAGVR